MARLEPVRGQLDQLEVVGRGEDEMRPARPVLIEQLRQDRLAGGDPLDRVGAAKQLVQQEQVWRGTGARADQLQERLDLREVIAGARQKIVGPADAASHVGDRAAVLLRQTGVDRLREYRVDADGAK